MLRDNVVKHKLREDEEPKFKIQPEEIIVENCHEDGTPVHEEVKSFDVDFISAMTKKD